MNSRLPSISIVIPTYNSERFIAMCLKAIRKQKYPKDKLEIIVVDNLSQDRTVALAEAFGIKVFLHKGDPPQVCYQRNLGAQKSKGEYLIFLDHDMEISKNLLKNFAENVYKTKDKIDAWYIPEVVVASNPLFSQIRTLEKRFYDATVINAARIIKREKYNKTKGYDEQLSGGPADWDMDMQLRVSGCTFATLGAYLYHHEESLSFWKHILKKNIYVEGSDKYREKWLKKNITLYNQVVKKQFSPIYRFVLIFLGQEKWRRLLIPHFPLFIILYVSKLLVGGVYIYNKLKQLWR